MEKTPSTDTTLRTDEPDTELDALRRRFARLRAEILEQEDSELLALQEERDRLRLELENSRSTVSFLAQAVGGVIFILLFIGAIVWIASRNKDREGWDE